MYSGFGLIKTGSSGSALAAGALSCPLYLISERVDIFTEVISRQFEGQELRSI